MHSIASVDRGTQTDDEETRSPSHSPSKRSSQPPSPIRKETEHVQDSSDDDDGRENHFDPSLSESAHIETAVPVVARARMVRVPKRVPPSLPPRNPNRASPSKKIEKEADGFDYVSLNGSEKSLNHLDTTNSDSSPQPATVNARAVSLEGKHSHDNRSNPGAGIEDEFHSVPPSPSKEHSNGIPGAV
jgi:hypothetical protein